MKILYFIYLILIIVNLKLTLKIWLTFTCSYQIF